MLSQLFYSTAALRSIPPLAHLWHTLNSAALADANPEIMLTVRDLFRPGGQTLVMLLALHHMHVNHLCSNDSAQTLSLLGAQHPLFSSERALSGSCKAWSSAAELTKKHTSTIRSAKAVPKQSVRLMPHTCRDKHFEHTELNHCQIVQPCTVSQLAWQHKCAQGAHSAHHRKLDPPSNPKLAEQGESACERPWLLSRESLPRTNQYMPQQCINIIDGTVPDLRVHFFG